MGGTCTRACIRLAAKRRDAGNTRTAANGSCSRQSSIGGQGGRVSPAQDGDLLRTGPAVQYCCVCVRTVPRRAREAISARGPHLVYRVLLPCRHPALFVDMCHTVLFCAHDKHEQLCPNSFLMNHVRCTRLRSAISAPAPDRNRPISMARWHLSALLPQHHQGPVQRA